MEQVVYDAVNATEERHWWYAGRRRILEALLRSVHQAGLPEGTLYDLGCGVGANLDLLERFGPTLGVDSSPEALAYCREKHHENVALCDLGRLEELPEGSGRLAMLADVLEHLDDEDACLAATHRLLKPGGALIVTVPAFEFLWSAADDTAHHRRRYTEAGLRAVIERRFRIERSSYFNTFMFPSIVVGRRLETWLGRNGSDFASVPPAPINRGLAALFGAERHLLERFHLPFGASVLCVARKDA